MWLVHLKQEYQNGKYKRPSTINYKGFFSEISKPPNNICLKILHNLFIFRLPGT